MSTLIENRIFDSAKIRLPGALDSALKLELFVICEEFLRDTNAWKELLPFTATPATDTFILAPEDYTFELTVPAGTKCLDLFGVYDANERKRYASMPVPGSVILEDSPPESMTLYAYVSLSVSDPNGLDGFPQLPDWITERHWPCLLDGLLYRMMSQPGKPYTSSQTALYHGRLYHRRKTQAKVEATRNNLYGAQTWSFPQTFNRR